jgi:hypothetical protein
VEFPVVAKPSVINEEIDIDLFGNKPIGQGVASVGGCEIGSEDPNFEMGVKPAKVSGEFLEAFVAAGYENEARGQRGELAGKFRTEPRRGSGDERVAALKKSQHV